MKHWVLYTSGIRYADLWTEEGRVSLRRLDLASGAFLPQRELTEADNAFYQNLTHMDISQLLVRLPSYDKSFAAGQGEVVTEFGERYVRTEAGHYVQRDIKFPRNVTLAQGRVVAFTCPSRERVHVLVEDGYQDLTVLAKWREAYPNETIHPVEDCGEQFAVMRDGVKLAATVLLPGDVQTDLPTVLVRTPYGKESDVPNYYRYVQRGYAVVVQDVRGRNHSEGAWMPNCNEVEDGDDTLNWIAAQPWSNGKVGVIGGSYLGYVQWAAAASGNPHLAAMISVVCAGSAFWDLPRKGGAFVSGMLAWAFAVSQREFKPELMAREDWDEVLKIRPLQDIPKKALGYDIPFFTEWLKHQDYDALWQRSNWRERASHRQIPALIMSGWFDDDGMGTTEALELTADWPSETRKVILGPWPHSGNATYDLHGLPLGDNALKLDIDLTFVKWFERHLKGVENGVESMPPVEYYTIGENRWKTAQAWPVPETEELSLYLGSGGYANTAAGDGILRLDPADASGADSYAYDPEHPAACIIDLSENEVGVPEDYTEQDARQDVLCYTTPPLKADMTLTGDFTVELFVSSDAVDTDFVVRINEVDETGKSVKLADGLLSARYREGYGRPKLLNPGETCKLAIRTSKLSNTFRKGSRLRLTVTSSAENLIFPHSNTADSYNSTKNVTARNTVHHGGATPSRVVARLEKNSGAELF